MGQFIYFKNNYHTAYPVGEYFSGANFEYIREVARTIHKAFPSSDRLVLVVRGHSGSILAGGIAYLLKRKGRNVLISVSRKSEKSHGENLEGIYSALSENARIIIVDDFIESGSTISKIIKGIYKKIKVNHFDMLCIANHWSEKLLTKDDEGDPRHKRHKEIISHFDYICCNKPYKD